jgi:ATP-dependent helicase/nuclease subunit A
MTGTTNPAGGPATTAHARAEAVSGIAIIGASAGTGKTHRLTTLLSAALRGVDGPPVRPEAVMAITYMRKAARELESRLRTELMRDGRFDDAARIRDGYLGTIHAVCQRLCREHALDAGLSPTLELVPDGEQQRLLAQAIADVAQAADSTLDGVARRLGLDDWHAVLRGIVKAARANRLDADTLKRSAAQSLAGLDAHLPRPHGSAEARDQALLAACDALIPVLQGDTQTKAGAARLDVVVALRRALRSPDPPSCPLLVSVQGAIGGVKKVAAQPEAAALLELLDDHATHPRFAADLRAMIEGIFDLGSRALEAFRARKARAQVLDYDDMLAEAYDLLGRPEVAAALSERLELLVVDEFQDISPLQLAIVVRLATLAGRAVWVGDPKQAILGFQGSDPELMRAAQRHVLGDRVPELLARSWRSRPALVDFTSELFARALARHGYSEARRCASRPPAPRPAGDGRRAVAGVLAVHQAQGRSRSAQALASSTRWPRGWRRLLAAAPPVRGSRRRRRPAPDPPAVGPAEPRDIAVLAYRHKRVPRGRRRAAASAGSRPRPSLGRAHPDPGGPARDGRAGRAGRPGRRDRRRPW